MRVVELRVASLPVASCRFGSSTVLFDCVVKIGRVSYPILCHFKPEFQFFKRAPAVVVTFRLCSIERDV